MTIDVPGSIFTTATGVDNLGNIVGTYRDSNDQVHGFLLSDGAFTTIDFPGAVLTFAESVNNLFGATVGFFADSSSDGNSRGFLLSGGEFTTIRFPRAASTIASHINTFGDIVGTYTLRDNTHGFLLSDGRFTSIDFPGARQTEVNGINQQGDIAGDYVDNSGVLHGFLRTRLRQDDGLHDLPRANNPFLSGDQKKAAASTR